MSKQITPLQNLHNEIAVLKPQLKKALPAHIPIEKFSRVLMTAISTTPDLVTANRNSLYAACLKLAQQGLLPDGKEAAIVTFGKSAQAMPMLAGILKLVRNSGELSSIAAHVVYENDKFSYFIDENGEHIKHTPNLTGKRGEITHVYAIAKTKDDGIYVEVMSKEEIDKVRGVSRAAKNGPWASWYGEMAKKSALRRLSKRLPMSTDLDHAITADDNLYDIDSEAPSEPVKAPPQEPKKKSSKLASAMETEPEIVDIEPPMPEEEIPI